MTDRAAATSGRYSFVADHEAAENDFKDALESVREVQQVHVEGLRRHFRKISDSRLPSVRMKCIQKP